MAESDPGVDSTERRGFLLGPPFAIATSAKSGRTGS